LALGSGFFVANRVIATNLHVIAGATSASAKLVGQEGTLPVIGIVAMDTARDLALLKIEGAGGLPVALGDSRATAVGDEVYVVGNPRGLEGTFSQGIVSGVRRIGSDTLLQITAPISPGSSGGPVLNNRGEVIGVAVASFEGGQNLNFAVPTAYVGPLLGRAGQPQRLAIAPRQRRRTRTGVNPSSGVSGTLFRWDPYPFGSCDINGCYTLSVRNQLDHPVTDVVVVLVFYDRVGSPIEARSLGWNAGDTIPPGLARRASGLVDESVKPLTSRVEIRILDFHIVAP